jgi:hypothetical protein
MGKRVSWLGNLRNEDVKRANFMERNVNAETTNKMPCQIYGLGYLIFLSVCGIRLLIPRMIFIYRMSFYRIAKSAKLNIYFQDIFKTLEEIIY